jgi:hypothetical protein
MCDCYETEMLTEEELEETKKEKKKVAVIKEIEVRKK